MAFCGALRRSLSTSSALRSQLVKTPIQLFGVEGRYVGAVYSAAVKQKQLDAVEKEIKEVEDLFNTNAKFKTFALDPTVSKKNKRVTMEAISKAVGHGTITTNFFSALAENGRLKQIKQVFKSFDTMMSAHRGEVSCEVTTAKALDATKLKSLEATLQKFLKPGQKLQLKTSVDPAIIGGMVVSVGDRFADMSIASKMRNMEESLRLAV